MKCLLRPALGLAFCVLLSSCVPTSDHPLASVDNAHADPALVGNWLDDYQDSYHITIKKDPWMHVVVTHKQSGSWPNKIDDKPEAYDFYPTVIDGKTFANVVLPGEGEKENATKTYTFIRYRVSKDHEFKMWSMSPNEVAVAVQAEKLEGKVHQDKNPTMTGTPPRPDVDVNLTSSSAKLVAYIQGADLDKLFINVDTLKRIESAAK